MLQKLTGKHRPNWKKQLTSKEEKLHKTSTWTIVLSVLQKNNAFVTQEDHKQNFRSATPCYLNPCKSELGKISKIILEKTLTEKLNVNQWKNTETVIHWFKSMSKNQDASLFSLM